MGRLKSDLGTLLEVGREERGQQNTVASISSGTLCVALPLCLEGILFQMTLSHGEGRGDQTKKKILRGTYGAIPGTQKAHMCQE